jgi:hypothetical protein
MPKGRPRKNGERYGNGRLKAAQQPEAPAARLDDFEMRDVVNEGQVVAQAYRRRDKVDAIAKNCTDRPSVDGDQWRALKDYADAWEACTVSGRSALDMSPSGGGGMEALCDARRRATLWFEVLHRALPPHLSGLVAMVCVQGVHPSDVASMHGVRLAEVYGKLREAADCLIVAMTRKRAA